MTRKADPRTARLPVPAGELPDFTPVPRRNKRHDGWTPERQLGFIEALADTGSVHAACKAVDMSQPGAYELRRQPGAESFREAWRRALDLGVQRIEDVAMDRALYGIEVPILSHGKHYGTRRVVNDRLLMFMLRNRAPDRFADGRGAKGLGGLNAIGQMEVERLKKKWLKEAREQWEAELPERRMKNAAEARATINEKLEELRQRVLDRRAAEWESLSEETRKAIQRAEELKARDLGQAGLGEDLDEDEMKALPPFPAPEPAQEEEPEEETGPRIRTVTDDGWG